MKPYVLLILMLLWGCQETAPKKDMAQSFADAVRSDSGSVMVKREYVERLQSLVVAYERKARHEDSLRSSAPLDTNALPDTTKKLTCTDYLNSAMEAIKLMSKQIDSLRSCAPPETLSLHNVDITNWRHLSRQAPCTVFVGCKCCRQKDKFPMLVWACDSILDNYWKQLPDGHYVWRDSFIVNCHWDTLWMKPLTK